MERNIELAERRGKKTFRVRSVKKSPVGGHAKGKPGIGGYPGDLRKIRMKESLPHHMQISHVGKFRHLRGKTPEKRNVHESGRTHRSKTERAISVADIRQLKIRGPVTVFLP